MSDEFYARAHWYDLMFPPRDDPGTSAAFYRSLAEEVGGRVLELACGTGSMLLPIAKSGIDCVGLDLSREMLTVARRKLSEAGVQVPLHEGNMAEFDLGDQFDLVLIASNSLLHLHETRELLGCFSCVRNHLREGGRFAFDVFNPDVQILGGADGVRRERARFIDPECGEVRVDVESRYDARAQVTREVWHFSTDDEPDVLSAPLEVRNIFPQELPVLLQTGGFELRERYGDFERSPFTGEMPQQVCVCSVS